MWAAPGIGIDILAPGAMYRVSITAIHSQTKSRRNGPGPSVFRRSLKSWLMPGMSPTSWTFPGTSSSKRPPLRHIPTPPQPPRSPWAPCRRSIYGHGARPEGAQLAGVPTKRVVTIAFAIVGGLTAIGAMITTARLNAAPLSIGQLLELQVIAACGIGGTSLAGGSGSLFGAIVEHGR